MEGCRRDFAATMQGLVNACVPEEDCAAERDWGLQIVMRSNARDAIQLMECLEHLQTEHRLHEVRLPSLLVHGTRDVITPVANSEHLARTIAGSRVVKTEGAGHVPTITRPVQVAQPIEAFFA
jgi:pimeloyl-ACP methyl ester carboxylesterase